MNPHTNDFWAGLVGICFVLWGIHRMIEDFLTGIFGEDDDEHA